MTVGSRIFLTGIALAAVCVAPPLRSDAPPLDKKSDEAAIRRMEQERVDAGVHKDVRAVADVTADDYLQIDLEGRVLDKAAALQRIASNEFILESNTLDDMIVRVFADTAIVTARSTPKGTRNGKIIATPTRYTRVYRKTKGAWRVIVFQMTRVSP